MHTVVGTRGAYNERVLAPGLLVATTSRKPLAETVALLVEHGPQGAFALAVNRPSAVRASELFGSLQMAWNGVASAVVWSGGPQDPQAGWILHEPTEVAPAGTRLVADGIALSTSPQAMRALGERPPARIRVLLGAYRWGPGELDKALRKDTWRCTHVVDPALVFATPAEQVWSSAVRLVSSTPLPKR